MFACIVFSRVLDSTFSRVLNSTLARAKLGGSHHMYHCTADKTFSDLGLRFAQNIVQKSPVYKYSRTKYNQNSTTQGVLWKSTNEAALCCNSKIFGP